MSDATAPVVMRGDGPRILIIGMMGSGKSTIGRALSRHTGWPYVDNDELIEEATGRVARDIMVADGEEALHRAERAAFRLGASLEPPVIVGVAGSVPLDPDAHRELAAADHVVLLRASPGVLSRRIGRGAGRRAEAASSAWMEETTREREAVYRSAATTVIDVDARTVPEIVAAILASISHA